MTSGSPRKARGLSAFVTRWSAALAIGCGGLGVAALGTGVLLQQHAPAPSVAAAGVITSGRITSGPGAAVPAAPKSSTGAVAPGLPSSPAVSLSVPALGIEHSPLQRLGENADGTVGVPTSFHQAGWYTGSVSPGQVGPTVILGHVDSYQGPGIFFRLGSLRPGETVSLARADGRTVTYRITGVREYAKNNFPTLSVYANTPVPTIRLITCGGQFDTTTRHYLANIVAYGEQIAVS